MNVKHNKDLWEPRDWSLEETHTETSIFDSHQSVQHKLGVVAPSSLGSKHPHLQRSPKQGRNIENLWRCHRVNFESLIWRYFIARFRFTALWLDLQVSFLSLRIISFHCQNFEFTSCLILYSSVTLNPCFISLLFLPVFLCALVRSISLLCWINCFVLFCNLVLFLPCFVLHSWVFPVFWSRLSLVSVQSGVVSSACLFICTL